MVLGTVIACSAWAETGVRNTLLDGRITILEYREGQVYSINASYGRQTIIRFQKDEEFKYLDGGNLSAWKINHHGHMLDVMPLVFGADTNLHVSTQDRKTGEVRYYVFELNALDAGSNEIETWSVEFKHPKGRDLPFYRAPITPAAPSKVAISTPSSSVKLASMDFSYSYSGDAALIPLRVFDDGKFTYFEFADALMLPIILAVEGDDQELIVNRHEEGIYTVVQQVADEYVLMLSGLETRIHYHGER